MSHGAKRKQAALLSSCGDKMGAPGGLLPSWYRLAGPSSSIPRYFRLVCLATATSAFVLGVVIGLLIPLYLLPGTSGAQVPASARASAANRTASLPLQSSLQPSLPEPPTQNYRTVSFVPAVQASAPVFAAQGSEVVVNASLVEDGVYWSAQVEALVPRGFGPSDAADWRRFVRKAKVVKMEEGCGRMQNRLLTFDNGSLSCCRYRQNVDQIQGEIFSFYLGRFVLQLPNLTPATLARVRPTSRQWSSVRAQLSVAQWASEDRAVVMTKFVPGLGPAFIPSLLRPAERRLHPPDLTGLDGGDLSELAQWSDLIVFDYLTANLDRVVNNLYNLQWNPSMMQAPAHNLARHPGSGLLLFLDNESGLLHGYRLLDKYERLHRAMLDALCVFRRPTARAIQRLYRHNDVGELLRSAFRASDPEFVDILPTLPDKSVKILKKRIARVHEQIARCETLYKPAS